MQLIGGDVGCSKPRIDHGAWKTGNAKNQSIESAHVGARSAGTKVLELTLENNVHGCRTAVLGKLTISEMFVINVKDKIISHLKRQLGKYYPGVNMCLASEEKSHKFSASFSCSRQMTLQFSQRRRINNEYLKGFLQR